MSSMWLQSILHQTETSVKMYSVYYPLLLLVVIPFGLALSLPFIFPYIEFFSPLTPEYWVEYWRGGIQDAADTATNLILLVTFISVLIFVKIYSLRDGVFSGKKLPEDKRYRIRIRLFKFFRVLVITEIIALIGLTVLFVSIPQSERNVADLWPLFEKGFYLAQFLLIIQVYFNLSIIYYLYLREDRLYNMANFCVFVSRQERDYSEKIRFLITGLYWYNKYLKRNFGLQFDEVRVASGIICSSTDKDDIVQTIGESLNSPDKLNLTNRLFTFVSNDSEGQLLKDKQVSTRIKEVVTLLAIITPALITVLQLVFPGLFPKPSG